MESSVCATDPIPDSVVRHQPRGSIVKDYRLEPADPNRRGTGVNLREGGVRWPVLRQALEVINYNGWLTIERSESLAYEERSRRLDLILAGQ
jgi:sugar phosphate isomerase/epimerase